MVPAGFIPGLLQALPMRHAGGGDRFESRPRSPRALGLWFCALAAAVLPFCTACWSKKEPDAKPSEVPRLVGKIASIPPEKRFVLIRSLGKWDIAAGTILTTRGGDGRSANLLVTGESLGNFAAADIQSGEVQLGDSVYSRHVPKPPPEPSGGDSPAESGPQAQESEAAPEPELPVDSAAGA